MNPLVSVIVPVYNMEKYLLCALDSVLKQSYRNIEVIVVDDCSQDNSREIISQCVAKDSRLKSIFLKLNQGPGPARNVGLSEVAGEYVAFLDPDDVMLPGFIESLLTVALKTNDALVKGVAVSLNSMGEMQRRYSVYLPAYAMSGMTLVEVESLCGLGEFWTYLYRRELLDGIFFPNLRSGEDRCFLCQVLIRAKAVGLIPEDVYGYRDNLSSVTRSRGKRSYFDQIKSLDRITTYLVAAGMDIIAKKQISIYWRWGILCDACSTLAKADNIILYGELKNIILKIDFDLDKEESIYGKYFVGLIKLGDFDEAYALCKNAGCFVSARKILLLHFKNIYHIITKAVSRHVSF